MARSRKQNRKPVTPRATAITGPQAEIDPDAHEGEDGPVEGHVLTTVAGCAVEGPGDADQSAYADWPADAQQG